MSGQIQAALRATGRTAVAALIVVAAPPPGGAEEWGPPAPTAAQADPIATTSPTRSDGRRTLGRLPVNLLRNLAGLVANDNAVPFLVGGALTGASFAADDDVREYFSDRDLGDLQSFGDRLGDAEVVVPLTAGLFLAGRVAGNQRFRDMTYDFAQAQLVVGGLGGLAKRAVGRQRPNGSNDRSFPSGHSYSWFASATVVERHYGVWAALPVYGLWAIAGLARIDNDAHYFSDVVAGATLGYLVARTTKRVNDEALPGTPRLRSRLQVTPWLSPAERGGGLIISLQF